MFTASLVYMTISFHRHLGAVTSAAELDDVSSIPADGRMLFNPSGPDYC
jgi:hypothetical protein